MERDEKARKAQEIEQDEMDTSGHGDVLKDAVDRVAAPSSEKQRAAQEGARRVDEEDMDTKGHGDTKRTP